MNIKDGKNDARNKMPIKGLFTYEALRGTKTKKLKSCFNKRALKPFLTCENGKRKEKTWNNFQYFLIQFNNGFNVLNLIVS